MSHPDPLHDPENTIRPKAKSKALKKKHEYGTHRDGSAMTAKVEDGGRSSALWLFSNNTRKGRKHYKKLNG